MDTNTRLVRMFVALAAAFGLLLAPITASATTVADHQTAVAKPKGKVKVHAKADKTKVKVGENVKLKGTLDVELSDRSSAALLEVLVVQQLTAGVWVDVPTAKTKCKPNGAFAVKLKFEVSASVSLRVHHPETEIYAAATSDVIGLVVVS